MGPAQQAPHDVLYPLSVNLGLYGGSFDPVHFGHMAVITAASERFDRLVVVVAGNSSKKTGPFTVDERVALLSDACRSLNNVVVVSHYGLLVDIARLVGADVLVRSAGKEHSDEKEMAYLNGRAGIPTLLIPSDPATAFISSSQVRGLIAAGEFSKLRYLVPASVTARLQSQTP
jgi:pantetheine-phosphate adenylyltransferase